MDAKSMSEDEVESLLNSLPAEQIAQDLADAYRNVSAGVKALGRELRTGNRRTVTAFAYIMHEERQIGVPSLFYLNTCLDGYDTFYFDKQILLNAYHKSKELYENDR